MIAGTAKEVARQYQEQIELRHLRYFTVLAEELHFARAAERLQIQQSPLSRAIREMERSLGVRLFERNTRSTRITRAGAVLLNYARRVSSLVEQASSSARSAALGCSNMLRISVSDCVAYCRMTEVLASYCATHPEVSVSLHEMPLHQQISWMRDDLLDASISLDGSYRDGINAQAIARDALCALIPAAHPLAQKEIVSTADLGCQSLILFSAESDLGAGSQIDDFVETLARPCIAFRASSFGTTLTLVALGHGIGLVGSAQASAAVRRDIVLRPVDVAPLLMTYVLHSDGGVSEPLRGFIEFARERLSISDSTDALS